MTEFNSDLSSSWEESKISVELGFLGGFPEQNKMFIDEVFTFSNAGSLTRETDGTYLFTAQFRPEQFSSFNSTIKSGDVGCFSIYAKAKNNNSDYFDEVSYDIQPSEGEADLRENCKFRVKETKKPTISFVDSDGSELQNTTDVVYFTDVGVSDTDQEGVFSFYVRPIDIKTEATNAILTKYSASGIKTVNCKITGVTNDGTPKTVSVVFDLASLSDEGIFTDAASDLTIRQIGDYYKIGGEMADGEYTVEFTCYDNDGNEGNHINRNYMIDTQKPTISFVSKDMVSYTNKATTPVYFQIAEKREKISQIFYAVAEVSTALETLESQSLFTEFTLAEDPEDSTRYKHTVELTYNTINVIWLKAIDISGNIATASIQVIQDCKKPEFVSVEYYNTSGELVPENALQAGENYQIRAVIRLVQIDPEIGT